MPRSVSALLSIPWYKLLLAIVEAQFCGEKCKSVSVFVKKIIVCIIMSGLWNAELFC